MKVVLELQDQLSNIKKVTVRHDIVIGRGAECNLRLSAPQVSRRHSFLRVSANGASLTDLDSSNGTWLNGQKLSSGKRYNIPDGAILAIGPVQFIARVRSEVAVGEELQVHLQDDRIEAEFSDAIENDPAAMDVEATISDLMPEDDNSNMNFAIEQGGVAAAEDEPTADFVPTDSAERRLYVDVQEIDAPDVDDDGILDAVPLDEDTVAVVDDIIEVGLDDAIELVDEVDVVDDVELIDDDEVLEMEDDIVEVVEESAESGVLNMPDDEADELKNFLKGLD